MSEDLVLRPYRRGDETEIITLMEHGFNGWPKFDLGCTSVEHWRWKYLNSPLGESSISVAVSGKGIIGFSQQYRVRLKIFDELIEANFAGDLVVHSEFRRRGLSNRLIELNASIRRLQGVDFVYFVTRNPHLVESYSKRYLQLPFPISNMVRIRDIDDQLDAIEMRRPSLMKIAYLSARVINRASNLLGGGGPKEPDFRVVETHQFDDRVDDLWRQVSNRHDFIVERRRDYLNWRYLDPRAGQYVIKQAESDEGRLLGFCVLRINRYLKDYPIGYVTDILTAPERPDIADSLIGEAARHFDENRVNTVLCSMVKNNLYYDILKRHGFLDSRTPFNLFFAVTKDVENVKRLRGTTAGRVYFSLGDIDSLPIGMERG